MESFTSVVGIAAPLLRANIDTDQIIPTRFLTRLSEEGLGEGLFAEWRVRPDGTPDPAFALNVEPWNRAEILVAGPNFGCGSSREAAPRALRECGFRAVIAPSFGDIFFNNCFRNGIVPVRLPPSIVDALGARIVAAGAQGCRLRVDLEAAVAGLADEGPLHPFETPALLRRMLLQGLDEVALTRLQSARIAAFRQADRTQRPWAYA